MAARKKALRSTRNGMIFPINEDMAKSDDVEVVYVDDKGRVIEPEEVGPAAAMDLPNPVREEEPSGDETQGADEGSDENKDVEGEKEQATAAPEGAEDADEKEQETASAADTAKATTRRATTRRKG